MCRIHESDPGARAMPVQAPFCKTAGSMRGAAKPNQTANLFQRNSAGCQVLCSFQAAASGCRGAASKPMPQTQQIINMRVARHAQSMRIYQHCSMSALGGLLTICSAVRKCSKDVSCIRRSQHLLLPAVQPRCPVTPADRHPYRITAEHKQDVAVNTVLFQLVSQDALMTERGAASHHLPYTCATFQLRTSPPPLQATQLLLLSSRCLARTQSTPEKANGEGGGGGTGTSSC